MYNEEPYAGSGHKMQTSLFSIGMYAVGFYIQVSIIFTVLLGVRILTIGVCPEWGVGRWVRDKMLAFVTFSFSF